MIAIKEQDLDFNAYANIALKNYNMLYLHLCLKYIGRPNQGCVSKPRII